MGSIRLKPEASSVAALSDVPHTKHIQHGDI